MQLGRKWARGCGGFAARGAFTFCLSRGGRAEHGLSHVKENWGSLEKRVVNKPGDECVRVAEIFVSLLGFPLMRDLTGTVAHGVPRKVFSQRQ